MTELGDMCQGRWNDLLPRLGVSPSFLTGKHVPCPVCGGKDRFRFSNKDGLGMGFCNQCKGMDGIKIVQLVNGWDFRRTAQEIESIVGDAVIAKPKPERDHRPFLRKLWQEARPIQGTLAEQYLHSRGLEAPPGLKYHQACPISHDRLKARPALMGPVRDRDGNGVAFHRTYLDGPAKANIVSPRQVVGKLPPGSAIRLYDATEALGVAEGIESAIGAKMRFGVPTWACISNGGLERFILPVGVKSLHIFGDADHNFVGQASAYALAARMKKEHHDLQVQVCIPSTLGTDWADA